MMIYRLVLTAEQLRNKTAILAAFTAIPKEDSVLEISEIDFSAVDLAIWVEAFGLIPENIKRLQLDDNKLSKLRALDVYSVLSALTTLETIELNDNGLEEDGDRLSASLAALKTARAIYLNNNDLQHLGGDQLKASFERLSPTVRTLGLRNNDLYKLPAPQFAMALRALVNVETLDLPFNELHQKEEDLPQVFAGFHANLKNLNLDYNRLGLMKSRNLVLALRAITAPLSILDVSNNELSELSTSASLGNFLAAAPASTLILRGNRLGAVAPVVMTASLSRLHPRVTHLDLNDNLLETKSLEELQFIFFQLPDTVTHIRYNTEEYLERAEFDRRLVLNQGSLFSEHDSDLENENENKENIPPTPFDYTFYLKCLAGLAVASGALLVVGILLVKTALVYTGATLMITSAVSALGLSMHSLFANRTAASTIDTGTSDFENEEEYDEHAPCL